MLSSFSTVSLYLCCYFVKSNKIVQTESGKVQGNIVSYGNVKILSFLGIPYAAAMTGNNRFKAPLPAKPWTGVLKADRMVQCTQPSDDATAVEDCLIINIFTPININETLLPIMVEVHAGAFDWGNGRRNGMLLVKREIVQITFNYRLGPAGFLCLRNEDAPGNAGQKDQVAALKWIQRNIINFGGDPKQVTLIGQSSGAVSAHLLVLSKQTKGLFQRAFLNGASALSFWGLDYDPIATAKDASKLSIFNLHDNNGSLTKFYLSAQAINLAQKGRWITDKYWNNGYGKIGFVPCVERPLNGTEAFLLRHPFDILSEKSYKKVPIIMSYSPYEAVNNIYRIPEVKSFADVLPLDLEFISNDAKRRIGEILKSAYIENKTLGKHGYVNYFSDSLVINSVLEAASLHSKYTSVYLFEFAVAIPLAPSYAGKAAHAALFTHIFKPEIPSDPKAKLATQRILTLMENFVKFGNPTPNKTSLLPLLWRPLQAGKPMTYLYQDMDVKILKNPYNDRRMLWKKIYEKFGRKRACC